MSGTSIIAHFSMPLTDDTNYYCTQHIKSIFGI